MLVVAFGNFSIALRVRWWTRPQRADTLKAQDKVLRAIKKMLYDEHGVDLPYPTQQILFHDQTEETDGDRARQREGWSSGPDDAPSPRRAVQRRNTSDA